MMELNPKDFTMSRTVFMKVKRTIKLQYKSSKKVEILYENYMKILKGKGHRRFKNEIDASMSFSFSDFYVVFRIIFRPFLMIYTGVIWLLGKSLQLRKISYLVTLKSLLLYCNSKREWWLYQLPIFVKTFFVR
jgi:hypothetical protein